MKNIYFLTTSYLPAKTGGTLTRFGQVKTLESFGNNIIVVTPQKQATKSENIIYIPPPRLLKLRRILQRFGIIEDAMNPWIFKAYKKLTKIVRQEDVIFATSGGDLTQIKLGSLLKRKTKAQSIMNFHDPLSYTIIDGLKIDNKFHISRNIQLKKYLIDFDHVITSSKKYSDYLRKEFQSIRDRIQCVYFGFINNYTIKKKKHSDLLRIVYGGNFGPAQKPEILIDIVSKCNNKNKIEIIFIGNYSKNSSILKSNQSNIKKISHMSHEDFLDYLSTETDIGFTSLAHEYFGLCVPSKIFEYINLELPIIGALPCGDAANIINSNKIGYADTRNNYKLIAKYIDKLIDNPDELQLIRENIKMQKSKWEMKKTYKQINDIINKG